MACITRIGRATSQITTIRLTSSGPAAQRANGSPGLPQNEPPIAPRFSALERRVRHVTGLILFSFATTHFLNHACGLLRLDAMEAVRHVLLWPWRTVIGQGLLYGSFAVHCGLGL